MNGWLILALLLIAIFGLLVMARVAKPLWGFVGAALMLGAAGYAWQGSPTLAGVSRAAERKVEASDIAADDLRDAIWGRFTYDYAYAVAADGLARAGATQAAVNAVLGGLQGAPNSGRLWTRLGTAILAHDGGQVLSPAARTAFARGIATAPDHPGPYFLYGMALIQTGDLPGAKRAWLTALARTPRNASYREDLAMRLVLLDRLMAMRPTAPAR
ncbi:tetratricopeptide repeat protein [Sphingomonas hankookensis]